VHRGQRLQGGEVRFWLLIFLWMISNILSVSCSPCAATLAPSAPALQLPPSLSTSFPQCLAYTYALVHLQHN